MKKWGLTGNQLKLIALITMTVDHVGYILLPQWGILRIIGRVSFPIYAYMIAEGCRHTTGMWKYFRNVAAVGAGSQLVAWLVTGTLRQNMLISFALAIGTIWLIRLSQERKLLWPLPLLAITAVWLLDRYLPRWLPGTDAGLDYGFMGVMLPVMIFLGTNFASRLVLTAVGLILLAPTGIRYQWWALGALPLLLLYNGQRGTAKLKWGFYIYYPLHLGVLYAIGWLLA